MYAIVLVSGKVIVCSSYVAQNDEVMGSVLLYCLNGSIKDALADDKIPMGFIPKHNVYSVEIIKSEPTT